MIEKVKNDVYEMLANEESGHGFDHIEKVLNLSLEFANGENVNLQVLSLIALLHDVDDYKLVGLKNSEELTNSRNIMNNAGIDEEIKDIVISELKHIGYSKSLKGIRPLTKEGQIVSDADMCEAIGVNGFLRTYKYTMSKNRPFFDKNIFPNEDLSSEEYRKNGSATCVCHFFEKLLKIKDLMMTKNGMIEASKRHQIMVDILYNLFREEKTIEWTEYLDEYLKRR